MSNRSLLFNRFASLVTLACYLQVNVLTMASDAPPPDTLQKVTAQGFSDFLDGCTQSERIQIAASARMLPDLEASDFGKFGLDPIEAFHDSKTRPKTFNDVPTQVVSQALAAGRINGDDVSASAIKKRIVWLSSSVVTFIGKDKENIDYHALVQWVAKKKGVSNEHIQGLPTFPLEQEICKKYIETIWDKLNPSQRIEVLTAIEKETGATIQNKAGIAAMAGGAAVAALGTTVALSGFAFYTTMSVVICTVAGWLGITLPFAAYAGSSTIVAVLSGPIGWAIAGAAVIGGIVWAGWPNADKTAAAIITISLIKARRVCANCNGTGTTGWWVFKKKCPECDGSGKVTPRE